MTATYTSLMELAKDGSLEHQRQALRKIRNEIIGSQPKKEAWTNHNFLHLITNLLSTASTDSSRWHGESGHLTLDAITILASLAHDNLRFAQEIDVRQILPVLTRLSSAIRLNETISLAALRALDNIAGASTYLTVLDEPGSGLFGSLVCSQTGLEHLHQVLRHVYNGGGCYQHAELVAQIVVKTCTNEIRRSRAANSGLVEDFALCLRKILFATCHDARSSSSRGSQDNFKRRYLQNETSVAIVLKAATTIVQGSMERARTHLNALNAALEHVSVPDSSDPYFGSQSGVPRTVECQAGGSSFAASLLQTQTPKLHLDDTGRTSSSKAVDSNGLFIHGSEGQKNLGLALSTMLYFVQSFEGFARLLAIWNAVVLVRCGCFTPVIEISVVKSLIPIVIQTIQSTLSCRNERRALVSEASSMEIRQVLEDAPHILAICIDEERSLQEISVEADVIPKLFALLKSSTGAASDISTRPFWRPQSPSNGAPETNVSSNGPEIASHRLEVSRSLCHQWRVRKAVLEAFAAIASQEDGYRKSMVEHSVVPMVVESLTPFRGASSGKLKSSDETRMDAFSVGNPAPVLLAACEVAKALCRSVKTLRTSLSDANLAAPLAILLKHSDENVQVAATAAVCNIVLEFSPMRQAAVDAGVIDVLCAHARSPNPKLRLNSLWALKHLVHSAPFKLKVDCLNSLGSGWLRQTLDPIHIPGTSRSLKPGPLVPSEHEPSLGLWPRATGISMADDESEEVHMIGEPLPSLRDVSVSHIARSLSHVTSDVEEQLQPLADPRSSHREQESSSHSETFAEILAIREQGLEVMRNLVAGRSHHEMADFILKEVGPETFVSMLTTLLSGIQNLQTDMSGGAAEKCGDISGLVVAVLVVVSNFAGSKSRHQQLIISAKDLLLCLIPLLHHSHSEVRKTCVWIIINLTWKRDEEDQLSRKARVYELRRLGALDRLIPLRENDPDLDIRERAKTAIHQMTIDI